jgi:hypothetical protein
MQEPTPHPAECQLRVVAQVPAPSQWRRGQSKPRLALTGRDIDAVLNAENPVEAARALIARKMNRFSRSARDRKVHPPFNL